MFSRPKKRNYMPLYIGIIAIVIVVTLAIFLTRGLAKSEGAKETVSSEEIINEKLEESPVNTVEDENQDEKVSENKKYETYYLVKSSNNSITIFFSNENGKLIELEETPIIYETLTREDQEKFNEGIKAKNRDELNKLIMNYES